jgi:RNA polymerase sigma factor (TIGR02999 family)
MPSRFGARSPALIQVPSSSELRRPLEEFPMHSDETKACEITRLLNEIRGGHASAADQLVGLVFDQLRRAARRLLQAERKDHTLQPTALVNEALIRLIGNNSMEWENRAHFFSVASTVMRHILTDHARAHRSGKRGGAYLKVPLDEGLVYEWRQPDAILELNRALDRLAIHDERLSKVVEMRFFAGMTEEEIAEVMQKSVRTIKRDWNFARDWLYAELSDQSRKNSGTIPTASLPA